MGRNRLLELDALRGIAALIVVLYHYSTRYEEMFGHQKSAYLTSFDYGHYGVQLFFMISGFVIYMSILKVNSIKEFVIKRMIRLYPAYIISILLTSTVVTLYTLERLKRPIIDIVLNFTMLQGFLPGIDNVDGVYWSLRIEITFYVLIALLIILNKKEKSLFFAVIWLTGSVLIQIIYRLFDLPLFNEVNALTIPKFSHLFILGMMFYLLKNNKDIRYHIMILLCVVYDLIFISLESCFFTILFTGIFYLMINGKLNILRLKPLIILGEISYSLYLVHQFIGYVIIHSMESIGLVHELFIIIPVFISILIAYGITQFIEKPLQSKLLHFYYKKQPVKIIEKTNNAI